MTAPAHSARPPLDSDSLARAFASDGARYFADADITQRLNLIRHLLQSTRLAIVVSGETDVGKTASLEQLRRSADERWSLCRVEGSATRDADALFASLARCCDLPPDCGRPALRQLLAEHAQGLSRHNRLPVIAVDDAHALSGTAWVELIALMTVEDGWRLLLYVEPGSDALLAQAGLGSPEQVHRLQWPALTEAQTGAYVGYRLSTAGCGGAPPLSAEQLRKLQRDSGGLPGNINRLAPALLADKRTAAPRAPARAPRARKLLRGAAVLVLVISAAAILTQQERINALFQPPPAQVQEPLSLPQQKPSRRPDPEPPAPETAAPSPEAPTPVPDEAASPDPAPVPEAASAIGPTDRSPPPADPDTSAPNAAQAAYDTAPNSVEAAAETSPTLATEPAGEPDTAAAPAATAPDRPLPANAPDEQPSADDATAAVQSAHSPADAVADTVAPDDTPPAPEPPAEAAAAAPPGAATVHTGLAGEQWVLSRPETHYTLQLLASRKLQPLRKLIERFELGAETAWYKIQYKGGDWYVLVHGDFADSRAASNAVAGLPDGLRRAGPWPRPLAAVQEEVRRGSK